MGKLPYLALILGLLACAHPVPAASVHDREARASARVEQLYEQGKAAANAGDLTRAEQYLSTALQAGYDPGRTLPVLLSVCIKASRLRSAVAYATPYLMAHPADAHLGQLVAALHVALGEPQAAERELRNALRYDPQLAQAEFLLGSLLQGSAREEEAASHFARYLVLSPNGPHAEEARAKLPFVSSPAAQLD